MNGLTQPSVGYEELLRGMERPLAAEPDTWAAAEPQAVMTDKMDRQQLADMLTAQTQLSAAAQSGQVQALQALVALAEALCPSQWDAVKRDGQAPEAWAPGKIGAFITREVRNVIHHATTAERPDLASEYRRLSREHVAAREEIGRLRLQIQQAQTSAQATANELAKLSRSRRGGSLAVDPKVAKVESGEIGENADAQQLAAVPLERVDALIKLVATTGLSRGDVLRKQLALAWGVERGSSRIGLAVRAALHHGLLQSFSCTVEWVGARTREFLVLTATGRARAVELGVIPMASEYEWGLKRHKTAEHLYLVLTVADLLVAQKFTEVSAQVDCLPVGEGDYCPDIVAREGGQQVYVECERSQDKAREVKWQRAAQANGGVIRLATATRRSMNAITSEIKATTGSAYRIWAFNVGEYLDGKRGPDGSIWVYQR